MSLSLQWYYRNGRQQRDDGQVAYENQTQRERVWLVLQASETFFSNFGKLFSCENLCSKFEKFFFMFHSPTIREQIISNIIILDERKSVNDENENENFMSIQIQI